MSEKPMTKTERKDILQLVRKREKLLRMMIQERATRLIANFEQQIAQKHQFDSDETWKKAMVEAEAAVKSANENIAKRCEHLGIPKEFAPSIGCNWYARGENAVRQRRDELRRVAKSRIMALAKETEAKIDMLSLEAETAIIMIGLESPAAKKFLESLPTIEELMPQIDFEKVKQLVQEN